MTLRQEMCLQPHNTGLRTAVLSGSVRDVLPFFHHQPSRHFDCDSIRGSNRGLFRAQEDNPVIFVLLATLGPFKRKEKKETCAAYCWISSSEWNYTVCHHGGATVLYRRVVWLPESDVSSRRCTATLYATPALKAVFGLFFNYYYFTKKPARLLSST